MAKQKAKINKTYITTEGTLYKDSIVRITQLANKDKEVRVKDDVGRIFYVNHKDLVLL
tara:strand:- start:1123 stop:1296 length:174 start_codon:yes stop_codon:yes gene_type:complete